MKGPGSIKDPEWKCIGHPKAKKAGKYDYQNKRTGEKIRFDRGKPTVPKGHENSHLYTPEEL